MFSMRAWRRSQASCHAAPRERLTFCAGAGPTVRNNGTDGRAGATGTPLAAPQPGGAVGMYLTCDLGTDGRHDTIRILIADDQQDIIDALRFLLLDEGYEVTPARSPGEALERLEASDFDLVVLDLNYTRDTTSGQEGLRPDGADPIAGSVAAGAGHDRIQQRRRSRRGDAPRRARLHREAVGRRQAAGGGADANRAAPRRAPQPAPAGSQRAAPAGRDAGVRRRGPGHRRDPADDRAGRPLGRERAHHRRARHGQGGRGGVAARASATGAARRWSR